MCWVSGDELFKFNVPVIDFSCLFDKKKTIFMSFLGVFCVSVCFYYVLRDVCLCCRTNWICSCSDDRQRSDVGCWPTCNPPHARYSTSCWGTEWSKDGVGWCCISPFERLVFFYMLLVILKTIKISAYLFIWYLRILIWFDIPFIL